MIDLPKSKYSHTEKLIQTAVNSGLTQQQIAEMCNVYQSVVSDWYNGKKLATVEKLKPLLKKFGDVGKKDPAVYLVCENGRYEVNQDVINVLSRFIENARIKLEKNINKRKYFGKHLPDYRRVERIADPELREKFESQIGRYETSLSRFELLLDKYFERKQSSEIQYLEEILKNYTSIMGQTYESKDDFLKPLSSFKTGYYYDHIGHFEVLRNDLLSKAHVYDSQIFQVNGEIIFEYTFEVEPEEKGPIWNRDEEKLPWMKWIIHELGGGRFCWVVQQPKTVFMPLPQMKSRNDVWLSKIEKAEDAEGIIARASNYEFSDKELVEIDVVSINFLITKAFLNRGYKVDGVKVIPKSPG